MSKVFPHIAIILVYYCDDSPNNTDIMNKSNMLNCFLDLKIYWINIGLPEDVHLNNEH